MDLAVQENRLYVPDTSAIIEGKLSKLISENRIFGRILIHKAVIAELENQANYGREVGHIGLKEIDEIRGLAKERNISLEFEGMRPTMHQIKMAKSGEIDSMIRDIAWEKEGVLITADRVQAEVAKSLGIELMFIEIKDVRVKKLMIAKYFDDETMSVHLRENVTPKAKKGIPGKWKFEKIQKAKLRREDVKKLAEDIIEHAHARQDSFIEMERKGSTIVQIADYRIVITYPPFSDGYEITAVKPVKKLVMNSYNLPDKLLDRLNNKAEGVLISGAPGHGKSTFAQALADFYLKTNKVVKTVEAPRDLQLSEEITQYSKNIGTSSEIHDILLLSRPDYTIFDEMRDTEDFKLYSDLRLAGVGMVGVIHGTTPIDSIQRFVGRIDLGMITSVIDTVIFIKNGGIEKVYELAINVKIPHGMFDSDLSRPVIEIRDFLSGEAEYEMYTFGEQTVVMPVRKIEIKKPKEVQNLASKTIEREVRKFIGKNSEFDIEVDESGRTRLFLNEEDIPRIIGKGGKNIKELENTLGIKIDVRNIEHKFNPTTKLDYKMAESKTGIKFKFGKKASRSMVGFKVDGVQLFVVTTGLDGEVKIADGTEECELLRDALDSGKEIEVYG